MAIAIIFLTVVALSLPPSSVAQGRRSPDRLQIGAGALPGVGLNVAYVDAGDVFTREATVYSHLRPRFASDDESLQVSAGIGVSLRIINSLQTMDFLEPRIWDLHLGLRFGPSLVFRRNETLAEKNQRFSLFVDPFIRFLLTPGDRLTYFFEAGTHRASVRAGVWLPI